jgi:hypothetical protein
VSSNVEGEEGGVEKCGRKWEPATGTTIAVGGGGALGDGECADRKGYVVLGRMFFFLKDMNMNY